jgi:hypothetical protein
VAQCWQQPSGITKVWSVQVGVLVVWQLTHTSTFLWRKERSSCVRQLFQSM